MIYSNIQLKLMRLWRHGELHRINILEGSVRSGKTWISLVLWAFWVGSGDKNGSYLMAAKTLGSLRRNCLDLLVTLVGQSNFEYSIHRKEGRLFGRRIYLEGASDARAENKIRGMTLSGAYCDELTLFPKEFFAMLLSRLLTSCGSSLGLMITRSLTPSMSPTSSGSIVVCFMTALFVERGWLPRGSSTHTLTRLSMSPMPYRVKEAITYRSTMAL